MNPALFPSPESLRALAAETGCGESSHDCCIDTLVREKGELTSQLSAALARVKELEAQVEELDKSNDAKLARVNEFRFAAYTAIGDANPQNDREIMQDLCDLPEEIARLKAAAQEHGRLIERVYELESECRDLNALRKIQLDARGESAARLSVGQSALLRIFSPREPTDRAQMQVMAGDALAARGSAEIAAVRDAQRALAGAQVLAQCLADEHTDDWQEEGEKGPDWGQVFIGNNDNVLAINDALAALNAAFGPPDSQS
jgi:predicted RNase H-like nuclease (RuvC/YqgF family)